MSKDETRRMAASGAVAGLCPVTEANLGGWEFCRAAFSRQRRPLRIGSDSNVLIGVPDELRQLEYSQRLPRWERNVLAAPGRSNGRDLFDRAIVGGSAALGASAGGLRAGAPADLVSLDCGHPALS